MERSKEQIEEFEAAENYRRQRQAADARKSGTSLKSREEYLRWIDDNPSLFLDIAKRSGANDADAPAVVQKLKNTLAALPPGSDFDDLGSLMILGGLVDRIEAACRQLSILTRNGVVFGPSHLAGLAASQMPVLKTDISIVQVTLPFITFCDLVSKALAHTVVHDVRNDSVRLGFDANEVKARLSCEPWLINEWVRILFPYATDGRPPVELGPAPHGARLKTRALLLDAMEVFAIAHEYGHHVLKHGLVESTANQFSRFEEEHQADLFARAISIGVAKLDDTVDYFLISGAGGALILGALDLVARARAVLATGVAQLPPRKHHPPVEQRMEAIRQMDVEYVPERAEEFAGFRSSMLIVLDVIWGAIKPVFERFHRDGVRVDESSQSPAEWLPLA